MASAQRFRAYPRFSLHYPVIFGGVPSVGEGTLTSLSMMGCSIKCNQVLVRGCDIRVSVLLPNQTSSLSIDLGTIKWVRGRQFGVEFLRLQPASRQRLSNALRTELIQMLKQRPVEAKETPDRPTKPSKPSLHSL
jgi:PilZ domain